LDVSVHGELLLDPHANEADLQSVGREEVSSEPCKSVKKEEE
jgi:hypothetical protein